MNIIIDKPLVHIDARRLIGKTFTDIFSNENFFCFVEASGEMVKILKLDIEEYLVGFDLSVLIGVPVDDVEISGLDKRVEVFPDSGDTYVDYKIKNKIKFGDQYIVAVKICECYPCDFESLFYLALSSNKKEYEESRKPENMYISF